MNAADVLATFGDACELLEYFEKTTRRQQTIIGKPSSTFTRKRPRVSTLLRNKESELNQNLCEVAPNTCSSWYRVPWIPASFPASFTEEGRILYRKRASSVSSKKSTFI